MVGSIYLDKLALAFAWFPRRAGPRFSALTIDPETTLFHPPAECFRDHENPVNFSSFSLAKC
jgi:hypothetical protein